MLFGRLPFKMRLVASLLLLSILFGMGACDSEHSESSSSSIAEKDDITEIICEGDTGMLDCGGDFINIGTAVYGRMTDNVTCPHATVTADSARECGGADVTDLVRPRCDNKTNCTVQSSNALYTDPCHGIYKYTNVTYSCEAFPQNLTWIRNYTFGFIDFKESFTTNLRITLNSEGETFIWVPCLNIKGWFQEPDDDNLSVEVNKTNCRTITVFSSADIIVHGIVVSGAITGGFLALPNDYLGMEYLIDVYTPKIGICPQVAITAISDNTSVTIDCVSSCTIDGQNVSGNIILNASDLVLLKTKSPTNLTGTIVRADKPISVVVGSEKVKIPMTGLKNGVIIEQLIPVSKWGRVHFVPPFQNATNGWIVRVSAFYPNTNVTLSQCGNDTLQHEMLSRQEYIDIKVAENVTNSVCMIISDMPVQVTQYMASSNTYHYGDPSMTLVPPVQDFHGNTTLRVENTKRGVLQYVDFITTKRGKDSLKLNGTIVSDFPGYCFNLTEDLQAMSGSGHTLVEGYCYFYNMLANGVYHVTQSDQSEKFLVRLYAQTMKFGGAMLADLSFQNPERLNITPGESFPQNLTWIKNYTFGFINFTSVFTTNLKITLNSEEITFIKVPCLNITRQFRGPDDDNLSVELTKTKCSTITVFSSADIIVHGIVVSGAITGGFLALPNDYLGKEYLIDVYTPEKKAFPQAVITAISDNTNVTIDCVSCNMSIDGDEFSGNIILNTSNTVLLQTLSPANLTGTLVRADKPVSVVVGSMSVQIPMTSNLGHGVIIEQLIPVSKWGRVHFVPPFQNATHGWIIRVSAFYPNTNVTLSQCGDDTLLHKMLSRQEYIDIKVAENVTNSVCMIISDMPVQVMQYMASSLVTDYGDPSMTLIPPVQDFHGNTTLRVENTKRGVLQYVDFITTKRGKDSLKLNGTIVSDFPGYCFNLTEDLQAMSGSGHTLVEGYCYFYKMLANGVYHVTQSDQTEKFLVRLYAQTRNVGGAMLADLSFQKPETLNITGGPSTDIDTTLAATTEMSDAEKRTSLFEKLISQGEFKTYGEAEEAMSAFTDYLGDRDELGSLDDLVFGFGYFTEVLRRNPMKHATGDNAQSFLNLSSGPISVLYADKTNELLANACKEGTSLESTPEDGQRQLEGLMNAAAALIIDGGTPSFGVSTKYAAVAVSSTRSATSSAIATESSVCEGAPDLNLEGVHIPCEVIQELGSRASYLINLPHGAEAVARSSCEKYDENKTIVSSGLLGVGLISEGPKQKFSSNITLTFLTTPDKTELMDNNSLCSFWDYNTSNWSTSGCTLGDINVTDNGTLVTCLCDHLTSFAVLLDVSGKDIPASDEFAMGIISWVGCSLSIVACFLTCVGYIFLKLHSDLILIHGNLALSVGLAEIVFLCLNLVQYESIPCTVVGALLYYLLLAMFAWMAIEGIHLYLLTFVVWNAERRKFKYYMACGWGVPAVFLIVLLSVYHEKLGEGIAESCFLSLDEHLSLLFFMVPVVIVIVFNLFVMIRVVLQIAKMADGPTLQSDIKSRVRHGAKAILILLPIMGLTWAFAFLAIDRASVAFQYIFVLLNSFQGAFIFLVHFVRNSEVRHALMRKRERWLVSQSRQADYRVKNTKKTTSSAVDKTSSSMAKTPEQTLTLMNMNTEPVFPVFIPDKNENGS